MRSTVFNTPKLIFSTVSAVCMTVLMSTGAVQDEVGVPFLTMLAGYILGNGIAMAQNKEVQPLFEHQAERSSHAERAPKEAS